MNETEQESSTSLAEALPPGERPWPPQPPWDQVDPDDEGVVGSLLSLFLGIPVLIGTALLEAPAHFRLNLK